MAMNGGSLEDCYSNVYALTELNGLKWRCFLTPSNSPRGIPIQSDPILKAYGKCLRDGLLCTWRRKPLQMSTQPEPLPLPSFTNEILLIDECLLGSAANGINYEVRVLFFQALHTMIERSMAHDGFVRFGRWFTRPLREPLFGLQRLLPRYFFVHGGNTVCMTVNAQRQPPLLRLCRRYIVDFDTILDLHFDSVFDACPICSCNTSIRARELGLYITPPDVLRMPAHLQQAQIGSWSGFALEQANVCTCGFSAVRHRYLSLCSGLFPEDSREATAIEHSVAPVNGLGAEVGLQASSQIWLAQEVSFDASSNSEYVLSQVDATELIALSILTPGNRSRNTNQPILQFFHPWGLQVINPREAEWRGLLCDIGPILERALQPKACTPIHDDDISSPEPIPYINVAAEKDAIRAAPHVVRHWEHLSLGPIDQPKDVLYLAVVPDIYGVIVHLRCKILYLRMYERMRFGRHIAWPTGVDGRDGCVRVGCRTQSGKYPTETTTLDFLNLVEFFMNFQHCSQFALQLFTQQMEENVLQLVTERDDLFERATFRETLALDWRAKRASVAAVALAVEQRLAEIYKFTLPKLLTLDAAEQGGSVVAPEPLPTEPPLEPEDVPVDDPGTLPHVVVIYVFNPFTWGTEFRSGLFTRVATLAVMRAFNTVCLRLPSYRRSQLQLEIIPMEQVTDLLGCLPDYTNESGTSQSLLENIRFNLFCCIIQATVLSVYSQPRVLTADCIRSVQARCMTRFGPGSSLLDSLDEWERSGTNVPSNPYHLAPPPLLYQKYENGRVLQSSDEQVLYVTYCVAGSDWLCVTVTDSLGRLNDNCLINLRTRHDHHIYKYRQQTQILDAMGRLWTYILGILSMETRNWRLVIGRLGRIGHGEFRAWTYLLNKTALKRHSARLKEVCTACAQMPGCTGTPSILSACLVSTEPEPYLRVFPGFTFMDEMNCLSKKARSAAPDDTSITHIMVFPTSADIQLGSTDQHAVGEDDWDFSDMDIPQDGNDLGDDFLSSSNFRAAGNSFFSENTADVSMENQPLATGFYVSTAPAADVPDWFWASCPSAKNRTPVHLKSSLHINVPLVHQGDEFLQGKAAAGDKQEKESAHPLDSTRTDEVLRHVLETYNALSWLNIDVVSGERRSCLPVHMQALNRLYHSVARLIM
ncbi:unnamed protein product [Angiostrongylus costaricensis]|uniref:Mediator of RNA polymerase II transcription subunit 13 n=1 Tax=Angiostrongylus costaricensis TaxID=334426 RepID=A0A0R3PQ57_ANGCS|nr:unnamed protein product [Angiostrongylus costaricensis]